MSRRIMIGAASLAAATLLLESALLRLLSIAQFYHFAFLVVSLALLGFGASGSLLSVSSRLQALPLDRLLPLAGWGFALSTGLAYATVNLLPFDSYSLAWDRRQILYFGLYFLALAVPFVFSGLGIGAALVAVQGRSHVVYAANLVGSAAGALLAPLSLAIGGVPVAVVAAGLLGLIPDYLRLRRRTSLVVLAFGLGAMLWLGIRNARGDAPLGLMISPYKGLSYLLQYPGSRRLYGAWSPLSRLDVIAQGGTRQLPGLSYTYADNPPPQYGLTIDAGSSQPITLVEPQAFAAHAYLPESLAFALRPGARTLVLEPAGGLGVLQALAGGSMEVTAVLQDPRVVHAVARTAPSYDIYQDPRVVTVQEAPRVFLQRQQGTFDVLFLPLTDAYRPVTSGAYSLAEDYLLTVEAFQAMLDALAPDGVLVATRWVQSPPSEDLRLVALAAAALEVKKVGDPAAAIVAYRGIQTLTVLVRPGGWPAEDLARARAFLVERRYDLVWAPDLQEGEVNRFNRLPQPEVYRTVRQLLTRPDPQVFFAAYPFAVDPPVDARPFFFHFFTWAQTPQVLATVGKVWQPFGGSGYFVLLAMLALVTVLGATLILAPLVFRRRERLSGVRGGSAGADTSRLAVFGYFALLGVAFLFVEIPLIQRWILLLGHPTYAFALAVAILLVFSGGGSWLARRRGLPVRGIWVGLVAFSLLAPWASARVIELALGWPFLARAAVGALSLAPLALLMGLPFPLGLAWLEGRAPAYVPWAWAVNGCASVVASVVAALVALSAGFQWVQVLGAVAYGLASLTYLVQIHPSGQN